MFNSKTATISRVRELENLLMQRDAEIAELRRRIDDMAFRLTHYQEKEKHIIDALTEAQASSKRIVDEAGEKRERILSEADREKQKAAEQAQAIIFDANREAEEIIGNAKLEAKNIVIQAEAAYEECKQSIERMNEKLKKTAQEAVNKIEEFRGAFNMGSIEVEALTFEKPDVKEAVLTPESYETPAELMKNIYAIQGRDIPAEAAAQEAVAHVAEPAAVPDFFAAEKAALVQEPQQPAPPKYQPFAPMQQPIPQPALAEYYQDPKVKFVPPASKQPAPAAPKIEIERPMAAEEERIKGNWGGKQGGDRGIDAELEALINDVLKDD